MGFKVKRTVEVQGTGTLQEFYVRVDAEDFDEIEFDIKEK